VAFSLFRKKSPQPKTPARKPEARPAGQRDSRGEAATGKGGQRSIDPGGLSALSESSSFSQSQMQIDDAGGALHPAIEEAAMLYANGQTSAAAATLEAVVRGHDLGASAERGWGMLFELFQILGRREDFEALALAYAGRFERSPPTWIEAGEEVAAPAKSSAGRSFVALTGVLGAETVEPMKQLLRMAESNPMVRLDAARVQDVDNGGAALLMRALQVLKKNRKEVEIAGADRLIGLLQPKVAMGRPAGQESWLLLLELLQRQGQNDAFEETALGYAVTFEVSPPSWEQAAVRAPRVQAETVPQEASGEGYPLQGKLVAAGADAFAGLITFAGARSEVAIDASRLKRIDFVSAGQLLNTITRLKMSGKQVLIFGVSHLIMGLFEIIGIGQMAEIRLRRA